MQKIYFTFVIYNARLNILSTCALVNGRYFATTEYENAYRPIVEGEWEQIGFL